MKNLEVKPFKNNVGALIETDLNSVNAETINEIKKALNNFGVIFFRKQNLSSAKYIEIAKHFGTCADYPMLKGLENFPEITVVEKKTWRKNHVWRRMAYRFYLHKNSTKNYNVVFS